MASTIIVEPQTYSARVFSDSFFFKEPIDLKYTGSRYHMFTPISSMKNTRKITFSLPPFANPTLWDLGNSYIEMTFKIVDEDGNIPDSSTYTVGFINNVLHSLFSDVKLYLNGRSMICMAYNCFLFLITFLHLYRYLGNNKLWESSF